MNKQIKKLALLSILCTFSLEAGWRDALTGLTNDAMEIWEEQSKTLLQKEPDDENLTVRNRRLHEEHFKAIWEDVIDKLEKGLVLDRQMEQAPSHAIFGKDKTSLRNDFNSVLDDIIALLLDDNLLNYRTTIRNSEAQIDASEKAILKYREKKIAAPVESHIKTTRSQYDEKIAAARRMIEEEKNRIVQTKLAMSRNFKELGIDLTPDQIDVLLARVDGDDIIQMTLVMDVLKQITTQLLGIMQESNEELSQAKKYYGMHMVLLELVVYIQDKFIDKISDDYLPRIDQIIAQSKSILSRTNQRISTEENIQRRNIYFQNLQSQQLTLKTSLLYRQNLVNELQQVKEARAVSRKNLELSKNTYETVTLSSDLYKIIASSQEMMQEVMKLQIPTIIPFENIQMKEKYQELTKKLQRH
jgi:hypothetical protein